MIPVFDGHNDVLLRLLRKTTPDPVGEFLVGDGEGHLDLPRMKAGGFVGGLFAVFIPSPDEEDNNYATSMIGESYDLPLPPLLTQDRAIGTALAMVALLCRMAERSDGAFRICRNVADIRAAIADGAVAAVLHFEGAEAIDANLDALDVFHAAGLRSLGPVWSRPTIFGEGVPFRYPSTPDTGAGLTDAGKALVKACNRLGIAIDLAHMNEKGFWDVARLSDAPLIASHSNAHAICPHARNLTDDQMRAIRDSGGIAGLNFATGFLRPDGQQCADTAIETMLRHLDHMIAVMGIEHVGIGSDFDGATIPAPIGTVTGLPVLTTAMAGHGYSADEIALIAGENWLRVLERTWGS